MLEPFSASFPIENQNSPKKEPAASPKTKAEILEYLVESLCGGYKNAKVTRNAFLLGKSGVQRQIDVLIDAKSNNFDIRIVIEAKNYNKKIGIEIIEALNTKLTDVGGNLGVVVCPLGFTEGAIKEAERCDIKLYQAFDHQLGNTDALVPFRLIEPFISIYQLQIVHGALNGAQFAIPSDLSKLRFEYKGEVLSLKELVTETWNDRLFPHEKGEHLVDVGVLKVSTNNPAHFNYLEVKINIIVSENCYLKMMPVSFMKEFKSGAGNHRVSIDVYQSKEDMEKNGWKYFSSREEMELVAEPIDTFPDMKGMQVTPTILLIRLRNNRLIPNIKESACLGNFSLLPHPYSFTVLCTGMNITKEHISLFQKAYKKDFKKKVNDEDSEIMIREFMYLMELLSKPLPDEVAQGDSQDTIRAS